MFLLMRQDTLARCHARDAAVCRCRLMLPPSYATDADAIAETCSSAARFPSYLLSVAGIGYVIFCFFAAAAADDVLLPLRYTTDAVTPDTPA